MRDVNRTSIPVAFLVPVFLVLIMVLPTGLAAAPVLWAVGFWSKILMISIAPLLFALSFVLTAAFLAKPFQRAIIAGKFPRKIEHVVYGPRRLYGLCWGAIYYFTPLYYAALSIPLFRRLLLRSFGYSGHLGVTLAPDAWLRDLPLLNFDQGVYVANKSTVGTNLCLANGSILVDQITLGKNSMIGHLTMVAAGTRVGESSEIGVGCAIGIRVRIGDRSRIGPSTTFNHGSEIGNRVEVGTMSYIGMKAKIADGIRIPSGSIIPEGAIIQTKEDVSRYISSQSFTLHQEIERLGQLYAARNGNYPLGSVAEDLSEVTSS